MAVSTVEATRRPETPTPVPTVSGSSNDVEDVIEPTATPTEPPATAVVPDPPIPAVPTDRQEAEPNQHIGTDEEDPWWQFREGYRDAGGNPAWEEILVCVVSKEGGYWIGFYGGNGYWTRAQFSDGDTWPKVQRFLISIGVTPNPDSPYVVGLGVGWWANQISHPSHSSGWQNTWAACT